MDRSRTLGHAVQDGTEAISNPLFGTAFRSIPASPHWQMFEQRTKKIPNEKPPSAFFVVWISTEAVFGMEWHRAEPISTPLPQPPSVPCPPAIVGTGCRVLLVACPVLHGTVEWWLTPTLTPWDEC